MPIGITNNAATYTNLESTSQTSEATSSATLAENISTNSETLTASTSIQSQDTSLNAGYLAAQINSQLYSQPSGNSSTGNVSNNPLYTDAGLSGNNPLTTSDSSGDPGYLGILNTV